MGRVRNPGELHCAGLHPHGPEPGDVAAGPDEGLAARRAVESAARNAGGHRGAGRLPIERCLGLLAHRSGDTEGAIRHFERALENEEFLVGQETWVASMRNTLAGSYYDLGEYERSLEIYGELIEDFRTRHGSEHPSLAVLLNNQAAALVDDGQLEEAESAAREALAIQRQTLPSTHASLGMTLFTLGRTLRIADGEDESVGHLQEAYEILATVLPAEHPFLPSIRLELARALRDVQRPGDALPLVEEALGHMTQEAGQRTEAATLLEELRASLRSSGARIR